MLLVPLIAGLFTTPAIIYATLVVMVLTFLWTVMFIHYVINNHYY